MMTSLAPSLIKWVIRPASPKSTRRTLGSLVGRSGAVVGMVDDFRHGLGSLGAGQEPVDLG
jgi:hypothetical protein